MDSRKYERCDYESVDGKSTFHFDVQCTYPVLWKSCNSFLVIRFNIATLFNFVLKIDFNVYIRY